MPDDSVKKALQVSAGVCFVCSILVSTATVTLTRRQEENKRHDERANILIAAGLYAAGADVNAVYGSRIDPILVDLRTGAVAGKGIDAGLTVETFDLKQVARDPRHSDEIPADRDAAGIKRQPRYMVVHQVKAGDAVERVILPVYGKGLWSTIYGFLALERDARSIAGITFYEHGETPGLGGEVDNPRWKASWIGKRAFDDDGRLRIKVLKGAVDPGSPEANYQVDGLSGATLTTRGVDRLVRFWLGDNGFGPYLARLREAPR